MTIEIDEHTYVVGLWYCSAPGQDFLAAITRKPDGPTKFCGRFRYYNDDKHFESDDEKSWLNADLTGRSDDDMIAMIDEMIAVMRAAGVAVGMRWSKPWRRVKLQGEASLKALMAAPFTQASSTGKHGGSA